MTVPEPDRVVWHTSSYSGTAGNCVEVGWHTASDKNGIATGGVLVRDSKDRTAPALAFSAPVWRAFLTILTR